MQCGSSNRRHLSCERHRYSSARPQSGLFAAVRCYCPECWPLSGREQPALRLLPRPGNRGRRQCYRPAGGEQSMKALLVRPVEIMGCCPAALTLESEFQIDGMNLTQADGFSVCFLAVRHFPPSVWQLQGGSRFFAHISCPGCTTCLEKENRVIFLLGHADKWELCQAISEYRRIVRQHPESKKARQLRLEAMQAQADGDFSLATRKMLAASSTFKQAK